MADSDAHMRVLMYSHDTFGLGHLRRTRTIAHALVDQHKGLSVLIISGSSIAGAFEFKARVDFIKIPSVIKLFNGQYTSLSDHIDISETLAMRRAIIESAATSFRPDVFIVDKEPRGLRGELDPTLPRLKAAGCKLVLGLREILDEPDVVAAEWAYNDAAEWVRSYFHRVWIYGSRDFYNPLQGLDLTPELLPRVEHVGFLARTAPKADVPQARKLPSRFILVTAGGGGDGGDMMKYVIAAREHDKRNTYPLVMVLGPFMSLLEKSEIRHRAQKLRDVHVLDFDNRIEMLMERATAVIAMGGYNTFCELMSFDKRTLIIPRKTPRLEQLIRARRAADFGLVGMIDPDDARDPRQMASALAALPTRPLPSSAHYSIDLGGLDRVGAAVAEMARERSQTSILAASQ